MPKLSPDHVLASSGVPKPFYKATNIKLGEREATVFYGFAHVGHEAEKMLSLSKPTRLGKVSTLSHLTNRIWIMLYVSYLK